MIDADGTRALLVALRNGAKTAVLEQVLSRPDLSLMFPSSGISLAAGVRYLQAVQDPALRRDLDSEGEAIVSYFVDLLERQKDLEEFLQDPRADGGLLLAKGFERTREYLPTGAQLGVIRFVLLPIGYDSRTDGETVYMDPLTALYLGPERIPVTLAHELHHVARYRLTGENLTLMRVDPSNLPRDLRATFREWATWMEAEGIADCVSSFADSDLPIFRAGASERRRQESEYAPLLKGAMEKFLREPLATPMTESDRNEIRDTVRNLAHPIGSRLAHEILADGGRPALIECVGRPAAFLNKYNAAARRRNLIEVDDSLIDWLGPE